MWGGEGVRVCVCIGSHCVYVYNYNKVSYNFQLLTKKLHET